jgi:PAS domain S-box-containing protein
MGGWLAHLFDTTGFVPRWYCGEWTPFDAWLHILADVAIWAAYFAIPCVGFVYIQRRKHLPFRGVFVLVLAFILACGFTHLMEAALFWWPAYRLSGLMKLATVVVSWSAVVALARVMPRLIDLATRLELEREIAERARVEQELRASEERFRGAFENAPIGMALVAPDGRWLRVNRALCDLLGYSEAEFLATDFQTLTHPDDLDADLCLARRLLDGAIPSYQMEKRYFHRDRRLIHGVLSVSLVRSADGRPLYAVAQIKDITAHKQEEEALQASLREKEALLKEIHHRVKNNLQIVSSLLDLQAAQTKDAAATAMFRESRARVRSMALIHERLYGTKDAARVDFAGYARHLGDDLSRAYRVPGQVRLEYDVDAPPLPLDAAIPCGLLLNELLSNCFKHAFPGGRDGRIQVSLRRQPDGDDVLSVADDGVGFAPGVDPTTSPSFGLQMVKTFAAQLGGAVEVSSGPAGSTVTLRFDPAKG